MSKHNTSKAKQQQQTESDENHQEATHWKDVLRTLLHYEDFIAMDIRRRQEHLNRLPNKWADKLPPGSYSKLEGISHAAKANQEFFVEMALFQSANCSRTESVLQPGRLPGKNDGSQISQSSQHRNQAVLHSAYREWSSEAQGERDASMLPLIEELLRLLPVTEENAYKQKVVVPGCGLGRLPLEIAARGYSCQGNEYSAFMAIASNFILNGIEKEKEFTIRPWLDKICNVVKIEDVMQSIQIPDVAACQMLTKCPFWNLPQSEVHDPDFYPRFSMCSGDFVEIYGSKTVENIPKIAESKGNKGNKNKKGKVADKKVEDVENGVKKEGEKKGENDEEWDAVVTCFFVDTAPVVLDYVDVIYKMLKPGGTWINIGPLLYHWVSDVENNNDERYMQSIELSWEELRHVIEGYGFQFQKEEFRECTYTHNTTSMMYTTYKAILFSVTKPL